MDGSLQRMMDDAIVRGSQTPAEFLRFLDLAPPDRSQESVEDWLERP